MLALFLFTDEKIFTVNTLKTHQLTNCTNIRQPKRKTSLQNTCVLH